MSLGHPVESWLSNQLSLNKLWYTHLKKLLYSFINNISSRQFQLELNDVIYGDVWICSGQSNMEWPMSAIFNAQEEIAKLAEYPNIRMYKLKWLTSDQPENDLLEEDFTKWAKSNETEYVNPFSAVCLLTARYMADTLGKDKVIFSL